MRCSAAEKGASANAAATAAAAGFWRAVVVDHPERPVVDHLAAAPPFVGPRIRDRPAGALAEGGAHLHGGEFGLSVQSLADAVGAGLGDEQRQRPGDVLQPRQVTPQLRLVVQVDVERAHVEERQLEVLGGREVDVGEQDVGRRGLGLVVQFAQEALDPALAVPADDGRWNLVAEGGHQHRRVIAQFVDAVDHRAADPAHGLRVVEEGDVLRPRQADHDPKAGLLRQVEDGPAGQGVDPHSVDAERPHLREVGGHLAERRELVATRVRGKRAVGHALGKELFAPGGEELP